MNSKSNFFVIVCVTVALGSVLALNHNTPIKADSTQKGASKYLNDVQTGNCDFKSMGRMSFGPDGLLLIADRRPASIVAIDTGDLGPVKKLKKKIEKIDDLAAASLGAKPGGVNIIDMTVNPRSGKIYLSVQRKEDNQFALLVVDDEGKISSFNLSNARYVRVSLPDGENSKVGNITDVEFANDRVLATGQCREEFSSKIFSIPLPLTHGKSGDIYSAKTYHVSHRRWETKAPIQSFIPYEEDGKSYVVGAFSCTPIAKFPLDDLSSGANVTGVSVVELGSGNRPLDMFTYQKDGKKWLVTNTDRFHHARRPIGPSQWWGCRIDMTYLTSDNVDEDAVRRIVSQNKGPEGIEVMEELFGAKQVAKVDDTEMVVLRDASGKLDLEVVPLP